MGIFNFFSKTINKDLSYEIVEDDKENLIVKLPLPAYAIAGIGICPTTCSLGEIREEVKNIGKKEGYESASKEYEKKLLKQSQDFLKQKKIFQHDKTRYENLIDGYEIRIDKILKNKNLSTSDVKVENHMISSSGTASALLLLCSSNKIEFNKPSSLIEEVRNIGRKEGYEKASIEYEKKLFKQAEVFLKQDKEFQSDIVKYKELIDDYKKYIEKLH